MIKLEKTEVLGWEHAIRGMRNPYSIDGAENNSWEKSDSGYGCIDYDPIEDRDINGYVIGPNDQDLMMRLAKGGPVHAKYRRMIAVYVTITAPLYWWKEFDTYRVGVAPNPTDIEMNSCSTMHKIHAKEFTLEDFSYEHLNDDCVASNVVFGDHSDYLTSLDILKYTIEGLNYWRRRYLATKDKDDWWQMIQLLPSSYNQKRTVMLNYEVLANMYKSRKNHKLDEWAEHKNIDIETLKRYYVGDYKLLDEKSLSDIGFCDWIKTLPFSKIITGEEK